MMDDRREARAVVSRRIFDDDDEWRTNTGAGIVSYTTSSADEIRFDDVEEIRGDDFEPERRQATSNPVMSWSKTERGKEWSAWWEAGDDKRPASGAFATTSLSDKKSLHDLQSDVRVLRSKLKEAEVARWNSLPVRETIKRMMLRKPYTLEPYKSYEDKVGLLQIAIEFHDGNCIMAVLQFLKRTLKYGKFFDLLVRFPEAETHYIAFLKQHYDWLELRKLYNLLARYEDEWVLRYNQSRNATPADTRVRRLEDCLRFFDSASCEDLGRSYYAVAVKEQINLLSRQIPIEEKDAKVERLGEYHLFKTYPRQSPVLYNSLITTLYYCCFYHYDCKPDAVQSPVKFRTDFKLSEKQYLWMALAAQARLRRWEKFEQLLTAKGWFGSTKLKSPISFDKIVELIHRQKATPDKIDKYARLIDDLSLRFKVLARIGRHFLAVQTLLELRDRNQLLHYQDKVPSTDRRTHDLMYRALQDVSIKWR
ncbi:spermatogenesis-defective protein 39 homolog [Corticium candelabrum]|uniref:spermatogenesis-defective protein 39 homolog n=1 Tax=Corticium candelabrum TaxID=121492 RepID=UPI002E263E8E|nr:spermatogenesis-defective protein 39 homolog [Corticium candelabrum]